MKISACYIVKNEAANICRSLDSLQDCVDEIIIMDTGSTDDTIQLVSNRPKVQVFHYTWQGDFAAARNAALQKAAGDWIIFLDADEYFSPETAVNLAAVIRANADREALVTKILNLDIENGKQEIIDGSFVVRIFRRQPGVCYTRRIHEQLGKYGRVFEKVGYISEKQLCILHTGYTPSRTKRKAKRNLALLLTEMTETKQPENLYRYLAEAYEGLGDEKNAIRYARMDIANGPRPVTYASRCYRMLLQLLKNPAERFAVLEKARAAFPNLPEFHAEYAEYAARRLDYEAAIQAMEQAFDCYAHYQDDGEAMQFNEKLYGLAEERLQSWKKIVECMGKLRVSACVIAKNERENIKKWLENAQVYSDEMILVDTGSTDGTGEFLRQHGVQVYELPWNDDFSAPRNLAIDRAVGDWIVFLDADEYFAQPTRVRAFLAEMALLHPENDAAMLTIANIDVDDHNQEIQRFQTIRMFRRQPGLRYAGRVHESVCRKQGNMNVWLDDGRLLIYHTGYSSGRIQQKIERNLALLQMDIAEHGEGPQHYRYLADCYQVLKDYRKSLYYALSALESSAVAIGSQSDMYRRALEAMRQLSMPPADMLQLVEQAIQMYPELPDFYAERGMIFCSMQRLDEAKTSFEMAISLFEQPVKKSQEATYFHGAAPAAYCRLGELQLREGEHEAAERNVSKALRLNPYYGRALTAYRAIYNREEAPAFVERIQEFYADTKENLCFCRDWADQQGEKELYFYFAKRLKEEFAVSSFLQPFYELEQQQKWQQLSQTLLQQTVASMQGMLLAALLAITADRERGRCILELCQGMFTEQMQALLQRFAGGEDRLSQNVWEAYSAFLPLVGGAGSEVLLEDYARMALDFSWAEVCEAADKLRELGQPAAAWILYSSVPQDAAVLTADFWHQAAVCAYQLRQFAVAEECFQKAEEQGCVRKDIAAYRKWMQEAQGLR